MIRDELARRRALRFAGGRQTSRRARYTGWTLEALEGRTLLTAALAALPNISVPATLGYQVPLDGSASGVTSQTYTVTSSNPDIPATVATGQFVTLNVSHTSSGAGDNAFSGPITFQLFQDLTPNTVAEIEQFVTDGFYNGTTFFRVASDFPNANSDIVQGGSANGDGTTASGQPGTPFPDEFNSQLAFTGTYQVAMANAGADTNDTQFFFTTGSPGGLNFGYTIFAQVVSGQALIQDMTHVLLESDPASGLNTYPVNPITITSATLSTTNPDGVVHIDTTNAVPGETATITVTATDPSTSTTAKQAFTVTTVADPNAPERPYVQTVAPITNDIVAGLNVTVGEGQTTSFRIPAVSPTPNDSLSYVVAGGVNAATDQFIPLDPTEATATVDQTTGIVTVTPAAGFSGTVPLVIGVRDQVLRDGTTSLSNSLNYEYHTIQLIVNPSTTAVAQPPIAIPITQSVTARSETTIQLESDNTDPGATLIYALATQPSHGVFGQFNDATGTFDYISDPGFFGVDRFQYTVTALGVGPSSSIMSLTATVTINVQSTFTITSTNPVNGSAVSALPNGQITLNFSHPIAGLVSGGPALSASDPFGIYLLQRGPDLNFSAPSGIDSGDLPLHINTVYTANANGTSSITITPLEPLATDVYLVSINMSAFTDTSGEPLYDPNNGYITFLLQPPPVSSAALTVTGVTTDNGTFAVNNNLIYQPDTLAIRFDKPLYAGAAGNGNVQLLAAPNYTPVASVATYSPSNDTIYLTPTATLTPGTVYLIAVSGAVSDNQGLGGPGHAMGQPYYDTFTVANASGGAGTSPLMVGVGADGNLQTVPANGSLTNLPLGYAAVRFTEPLNLSPTVFGRYSAMLDPRTEGADGNAALENVPVNAQLAFNPNTDELIIVPTQATSNGLYVLALSNMQAQNGDHLETSTGQQAGVTGPPVYATFEVQAGAVPSVAAPAVLVAGSSSPNTAAPAVLVAGNSSGQGTPAQAAVTPVARPAALRPRRPVQPADVRSGAPGAARFSL